MQGVFCCAIDLNFRLTESWGELKSDSKGEVACPPPHRVAIKKKKKTWAGISKASGTMP